MGAAGRDFHNFNMVYRDNPGTEVIAFTAAQIPDISGRCYPASLAGSHYPAGIPILDELELERLCRENRVDQVVFAYSDVSHGEVMNRASIALSAGADFVILGPDHTMLQVDIPVIAITAVRTGCGKSQTARWLSKLLKDKGFRVAVIRHPMPYGDLERQTVQRFASSADLDAAQCTIEEREEYEPHLKIGNLVFAGVDYAAIVSRAETEADIILWDGGNNDFSFIRPNLNIVLVDPLRPGHETTHHPGEAVLRMADIVLVAKTNSAPDSDIQKVTNAARRINPRATVVRGASPVFLDDPEAVRGKRVLVIEDGPTITHGGMSYGAGLVAATEARAAEIVDPRSVATQDYARVFAKYPHIGAVLPALGYFPSQLKALRDTINAADIDVVVDASPCDLSKLIDIDKPVVQVSYEFEETGDPRLSNLVDKFLRDQGMMPQSQ
jgi:predicted GTPase